MDTPGNSETTNPTTPPPSDVPSSPPVIQTPPPPQHEPLSPQVSSELIVRVTADEEDDEEYVDDQEAGPRPFPYRMCGVAFLLVAIATAVILASVPAAVNGKSLTNDENGMLYHLLIGAFLLMLFSCLFFTYYLGGSKDTWEDPVFSGIRLNFSNITAIIGLFLEFVQICSFSFNYNAIFTGSNQFLRMQYVAMPYSPGAAFRVMYWIMFVVAFSPYIFVVSVRMIIYTINRRKGEAEAAAFVQAYQQKIYSILWFLVNTIYIPVISTMMAGIDCTFRNDSPDPNNPLAGNTLDSDPSCLCLSREHIKYLVCTLIALVIYYPAASFAQAQTQNISDIKFKPKVVFIFVQGKVLLAGAAIFYTDYTIAYLVFVLVIDMIFLGVNVWKSPCLVQWVNQLRTIFFVISVVSVVASLIATSKDISLAAPLVILIIGWVAAGVGLPILFFVYSRIRENLAKK